MPVKVNGFLLSLGLMICVSISGTSQSVNKIRKNLVDPKATRETAALFYHLRKLSDDHVMFGISIRPNTDTAGLATLTAPT